MNALKQLQIEKPLFKAYHENYALPLLEFLGAVLANRKTVEDCESVCVVGGYEFDVKKEFLCNYFIQRRIHAQGFYQALYFMGYPSTLFPIEKTASAFKMASMCGELYKNEARWVMISDMYNALKEYLEL